MRFALGTHCITRPSRTTDTRSASYIPLTVALSFLFSGAIGACVQAFFSFGIYRFSRGSTYLASPGHCRLFLFRTLVVGDKLTAWTIETGVVTSTDTTLVLIFVHHAHFRIFICRE
ncbi:hypothetical protein C8R43DRAFT_205725 [Mycena crocata]|nr:hypothetical protein C8R43DRAFT_205725 [Mycena crocata]